MRDLLLLAPLKAYRDAGLLALRWAVGGFLLWSIHDALTQESALRAYAAMLARFHFLAPYLMARLSIYAQLLIAAGLIAGLATRWAGILCAAHFAIALVMVERYMGMRASVSAGCLAVIGLHLALQGSGRFGIDAWLGRGARGRLDSHY